MGFDLLHSWEDVFISVTWAVRKENSIHSSSKCIASFFVAFLFIYLFIFFLYLFFSFIEMMGSTLSTFRFVFVQLNSGTDRTGKTFRKHFRRE